jgi:hypothetical protein
MNIKQLWINHKVKKVDADIQRMLGAISSNNKTNSVNEVVDVLFGWLVYCGHKKRYIDIAITKHMNTVISTSEQILKDKSKKVDV